MIVTEDEAKTKRCQESFGDQQLANSGYAVPSPNHGGYGYGYGYGYGGYGYGGGGIAIQTSPVMCIGSACMAWRWAVADRSDTYGRKNANKGFCGKAGKP